MSSAASSVSVAAPARAGVDDAAIASLAAAYPRNLLNGAKYDYGTAGFRLKAGFLPSIAARMGMLAALRSLSLRAQYGGRCPAIGVMITASHNAEPDNGVKIVDADGGMLAMAWEKHAVALANCEESGVAALVNEIKEKECTGAGAGAGAGLPRVHVGQDNRPSSPALAAGVVAGAQAVGAETVSYGEVSTPQLHWVTGEYNKAILAAAGAGAGAGEAPAPTTLATYTSTIAAAFTTALTGLAALTAGRDGGDARAFVLSQPPLVLDCAHGVGFAAAGAAIAAVNGNLAAQGLPSLVIHGANGPAGVDPTAAGFSGGAGAGAGAKVNEQCGADYVQKEKVAPKGVDVTGAGAGAGAGAGVRFASFDGDGDRLVYYIPNAGAGAGAGAGVGVVLLDGDKMMTAAAAMLSGLIGAAGITVDDGAGADAGDDDHHGAGAGAGADTTSLPDIVVQAQAAITGNTTTTNNNTTTSTTTSALKIGVVQTAYANGSSTAYLSSLPSLTVAFACTGVKHLHHVALGMDIGLYFEPNGHGTVLFSAKAKRAFAAVATSAASTEKQRVAAGVLLALSALISPFIGDAVSDLFLVEAALGWCQWSQQTWSAVYSDLPSKMDKCVVKDRTAVTTTNAERVCVTPMGLQAAIDAAVAGAGAGARSFVRPSGTEDIVRVYAEAGTQAQADALCAAVQALVTQYCS